MKSISNRLDELYGASVGTLVRKKGEVQFVRLYADYLEDAFAQARARLCANDRSFLGGAAARPVLRDGHSTRAAVEGEKLNLVNAIEARINDKRTYSISPAAAQHVPGREATACRGSANAEDRGCDQRRESLYDHYPRDPEKFPDGDLLYRPRSRPGRVGERCCARR
jgi:hypothetical protein